MDEGTGAVVPLSFLRRREERHEHYEVEDAFIDGIICDVFGIRLVGRNGVDLAHVEWDRDTGECMRLWVHPSRQREGIATRLWREAQGRGAVHSKDRTLVGQAWALSLGDELPPWHIV